MSFEDRKEAILKQLHPPDGEYSDLSPKGSVDVAIQDLINDINAVPGFVTTSSCSGRTAVYLEGQKSSASAKSSGKGGGRWLHVSHEPLDINAAATEIYAQFEDGKEKHLDTPERLKLAHFKCEAMILHILCASLADAQRVLAAALQAGFRESGAINLLATGARSASPMVAVRSTGLGLDTIIGYATEDGRLFSLVSKTHLKFLLQIANERFDTNTERISRFRRLLLPQCDSAVESKEQRRQRKRTEGLKAQQMLQRSKDPAEGTHKHETDADMLGMVNFIS